MKQHEDIRKIKIFIFGDGVKDVSDEKWNECRLLLNDFQMYMNRKEENQLFNILKQICNALIIPSRYLPLRQNQNLYDYLFGLME